MEKFCVLLIFLGDTMVLFCPLSSGSKGNAILLSSSKVKILIDNGISYLEMTKRLAEIQLLPNEINAQLISHEHSDHIQGLKVFNQKHNVPVFANSETAKAIYGIFHCMFPFKIFTTGEPFTFEDLEVFSFSVPHDTLDPVGFIITTQGFKIGICTDFGILSSHIKNILKECHLLYIEANHQVSMVHASNRPPIYKQRVLSRQGHLSNEDCFKLLSEIVHPNLQYIYLAHISEECNSTDLLCDMMEKFQKDKKIKIPFSIAKQSTVSEKITLK